MTNGPRRITIPTLIILSVFVEEPARERYGYELSQITGLGTGTVLMCLYRLEGWGWLSSRWEDKDVATHDGRPPRRFYTLTGVGEREAQELLARRLKGRLRFGAGTCRLRGVYIEHD